MSQLPPVIQLAISEELWDYRSPQELKEALKAHGLGEELSRQAEWTLDKFDYVDSSGSSDRISLSDSL